MNREDIMKASVEHYGHEYQFKTRKAFIKGAEWMQEQNQAEIRHLEALVETQKAIIDYNENRLSELTEQLDAAHIFCEGVKEHYTKAIEEAYNKMLHDGTILITKSQFIECFKNI